MGFLSVFKRDCPGEGKKAVRGDMTITANPDDGPWEFAGQCPECGKVRPCDMYSTMLPHRE